MDCSFENASLFKKLVEGVRELNKDINIDASPEGLRIQSMDSSHVALISAELRQACFSSFECPHERRLGVQMDYLAKILKMVDDSHKLRLSVPESGNELTITSDSGDSERMTSFDLKLMEIEADALGVPEQEMAAEVTMKSRQFANIIRDMATFGDTMTIDVEKNNVKFVVQGDSANGTVSLANGQDIAIKCTQPCKNNFAVRYLNMFGKAAPLSDKVTIRADPELPLLVEFKLENEANGILRFYLAPKVDDAM